MNFVHAARGPVYEQEICDPSNANQVFLRLFKVCPHSSALNPPIFLSNFLTKPSDLFKMLVLLIFQGWLALFRGQACSVNLPYQCMSGKCVDDGNGNKVCSFSVSFVCIYFSSRKISNFHQY